MKQHILALLKKAQENVDKQAILEELQSLDKDIVLKILEELINCDELEIQDIAIKILMQFDANVGVNLLLPLLNHPEESLRWYICRLLINFGNSDTVLPLVDVLRKDNSGDVRYMAVVALEKTGDKRALPILQHVQQYDVGTDYEGRSISELAKDAILAILGRE